MNYTMDTVRKIKILQAIRQGKIGGGESHVLELCTRIDKDKFEVVVLSFTDGSMVEELNRRGIRTKVIYTEKGFDKKIWKKVSDFAVEEKFDIIHAHGTRAASNVFMTAKKLHIPLIYTVHGWSFHQDQNFLVHKMRTLSEKFLTGRANLNICVSKSNQEEGIKRFNLKRSALIYNAVDLNKFDPEGSYKDIRAELNIPAGKIVIGYIARITRQKDPETFVKAMKLISESTDEIVALMVGDGELKEEAMQLAKTLNIQDKITFQPFRTDIPDILHAIDIYALPSLWEGFPIGILEAMAMKKCVIASPVDGTKELIKDGITGLMAQCSNPDRLAEAILLLADDEKLRSKIALNAYNYVGQSFGISRLIDEIQAVYSGFDKKLN